MIHHESQVKAEWKTGTIAAVAAVTLLLALVFPSPIRIAYENVIFALWPSAERAMGYADGHFDAQNPVLYDIARAEYFYKKAEALDTKYPHLYHQLARIEFLKGNFNTAIFYINKQIDLHGDAAPSSYYVRGLIEGYMGRYAAAADDYEHFLEFHPSNWAGLNDYAWVLLKANRPSDAARAADEGLKYFPDNPWLLNSSAIALYETGSFEAALARAEKAVTASMNVTEKEWLTAYPGNDPRVAKAGIATLQKSALDNMHRIEATIAASAVQ